MTTIITIETCTRLENLFIIMGTGEAMIIRVVIIIMKVVVEVKRIMTVIMIIIAVIKEYRIVIIEGLRVIIIQ